MGDEAQFGFKITGDASSLVAASQQTNAALESNRIKLAELTPEQKANATALTQTGEAAKESGKAVEEAGKGAEKSAHGHRDLRFAVRGLREEFPELAHVAHMALHPITLVVAGIGGAFALFKYRVEEATKALAGVELPQISEQKVGQVTAMAEAWKSFKDALDATAKSYNGIEAASARAMKQMEAEAALQKKLLEGHKQLDLATLEANKSGMSPAEYEKARLGIEDHFAAAGIKGEQTKKEDEIYQKQDEVHDLRNSAAKKLAESARIKVGTAEQDAQTEADLKAQADAAKKDMQERWERINRYKDYQSGDGNPYERMKTRLQLNAATGTLLGRSLTPGEIQGAIDTERGVISSEESTVGRYTDFMRRKAARDEARKRKTGLAGEAGSELGRANNLDAQSGDEMGDASREFGVNKSVESMGAKARTFQALGKANDEVKQLLQEIMKLTEAHQGVSAELIERVKAAEQKAAELEKRLRDQEGRAPRI